VGVIRFVGAVEDKRGTWGQVHLCNTVSPFLVVFVGLLRKFAGLWSVAMLLAICYISSFTSIPPGFTELEQEFLGLLPSRALPNLRPRLYGHHVRGGSKIKTKMIPMDQMTMSTGDDLDEDNMNTDVRPNPPAYRDDKLVHT
jgi:hypothetical protein